VGHRFNATDSSEALRAETLKGLEDGEALYHPVLLAGHLHLTPSVTVSLKWWTPPLEHRKRLKSAAMYALKKSRHAISLTAAATTQMRLASYDVVNV